MEATSFSPESSFKREFTLQEGRHSGRIAFSIDDIDLDQQAMERIEDTVELFGVLLLTDVIAKNLSKVDFVANLERALLSHLEEQNKIPWERLAAEAAGRK